MASARSAPLFVALGVAACSSVETTAPVAVDSPSSVLASGYSSPVKLPVLSSAGPSRANDVNANGAIAGQSHAGTPGHYTHAVRWDGNVITDLGVLPGHRLSAGYGINGAKTVVGISCDSLFHCKPIRHVVGAGLQVLASPAVGATAMEVNDAGVIVGYSLAAGDSTRALKWTTPVAYSDITPAGYKGARAIAIDKNGAIVGEVITTAGTRFAYRWAPGGEGAVMGDAGYVGTGMSISGIALGYSLVTGGTKPPFLWNGKVEPVAAIVGTLVTDVSSKRRIVGTVDSTAVTWDGKLWGDLPKGTYATTSATAVNDCGTVVGAARTALFTNEFPVRWSRRVCE